MKTNLSRSHLWALSLSCGVCLGFGGFMASALAETTRSGGAPSSSTSGVIPSTLAVPPINPASGVSEIPASTTGDTNATFSNEIPEVPGSDVLEAGTSAIDPSVDTPRQSSGFNFGKILTAIPIQDILQKNPQVLNYFKKNPEIVKIFVDNPQILEFLIKNVGPKGF